MNQNKNDMDFTLEEKIIKVLSDKNWLISTAESCTGGMVSSRIVNVSGSSFVFKEGIVTYSNEAKSKYLKVKEDTLMKYGAVSIQTAGEMLTGLFQTSNAQVCIAVTGIAGPLGGTNSKPVGTVYIGCKTPTDTVVEHHVFDGDRYQVRCQSAQRALELAYEMITGILYSK